MKRIIIFICLFFVVLQACDTTDSGLNQLKTDNLTIISDATNLLTARIQFESSRSEGVILEVVPLVSDKDVPYPVIHMRNPDNQIRFDIVGLKESTAYSWRISDALNGGKTVHEGTFESAPLPEWMRTLFPGVSNPLAINGLLILNTFATTAESGYGSIPSAIYIIDTFGRPVLARLSEKRISVAHFTPRGTLLTMENEAPGTTGSNIILETSLAGDTLAYLRYGTRGFDRLVHHDVVLTDDHQFLAITESEKNGVVVDGLMKLDRSGNLVWQWDTSEHNPTDAIPYIQPWGNSISFDESGNIIVSFRRISQVWKVNKDTRQVMWRLGRDGTIPVAGDDSFLLQHTAKFVKPGRLMMFDNGQDRSSPIFLYDDYRPYSRIAFYDLDRSRKTVTGTAFFDLPEKYFSWANGSVSYIPESDSYLVGSSFPGYILHLDNSGAILGELDLGIRFYRVALINNFLEQ
jgi:hypothetical protein